MKEVTLIREDLWHIVSEPGDATRYDYYVAKFGDKYTFMPCENTFRFPQKLDYWKHRDLEQGALLELAQKELTNYATLKECIRTMTAIQDSADEWAAVYTQ